MTADQKKFEQFFFNDLIVLSFEEACAKIKEIGNQFELKKIDTNGNCNIFKNADLYATFTSEGLSFK